MAFDLSKKKTNYSENNEKNQLEKYNEVPQDAWKSLPKGTKIKYVDEEGKLKFGGFVVHTYVSKKGKNSGNDVILLEQGRIKWEINLKKIKNLYKLKDSNYSNPKIEKEPPIDIQTMKFRLESLENEISTIKGELQKIAKTLGYLYKTLKNKNLV